MSDLIDGKWYLIKNEKGDMVNVSRCIQGKLNGFVDVETVTSMGGTIYPAVVMTQEEFDQRIIDEQKNGLDLLLSAITGEGE